MPDRDDELLRKLRDADHYWGSHLDWLYNYDGGDRAWEAVLRYHGQVVENYRALSPAFHERHPELQKHFPEIEDKPQGAPIDRFSQAVRKAARERLGEETPSGQGQNGKRRRGPMQRILWSILALCLVAGHACQRSEPPGVPERTGRGATPAGVAAPAPGGSAPAPSSLVERLQLAKVEACAIHLERIHSELLIHYVENRGYPATLDALALGSAPVLRRRGLLDPWGRALSYELAGQRGFRLCSAGPDGTVGSTDDICRTEPSAP